MVSGSPKSKLDSWACYDQQQLSYLHPCGRHYQVCISDYYVPHLISCTDVLHFVEMKVRIERLHLVHYSAVDFTVYV